MYRICRVARAAGLGVLVAAGCAPDVPVLPSGALSFDAAAASRPPFVFPAGATAGQKGVVGVAPGAVGYHGGHWKFFAVTWNVTPYLLTSETAVLAAAAAGDATVTRVPDNDFKCPIQP